MDGRSPRHPVPRGGREAGRQVVPRRGRGRRRDVPQRPRRESLGRRADRLRPERRAASPRAGLSGAAPRAGLEGSANVKWIRRIELADRPFMTREETAKYTDPLPNGTARMFSFVMDAKSIITS